MSVRVSPRGGWILVKPEQRPAQAGAVYLSVTTHGETGVVLDAQDWDYALKVGDRVLFDLGAARGAGVENPDLVLVKFDDIRAVLEREMEEN